MPKVQGNIKTMPSLLRLDEIAISKETGMNEEKPFKCFVCGAQFRSTGEVVEHQKETRHYPLKKCGLS